MFDFSDMVNRQSFEKTVTYLKECFDWRNQEPVQEQNHLLLHALLYRHTSVLQEIGFLFFNDNAIGNFMQILINEILILLQVMIIIKRGLPPKHTHFLVNL